MLKSRDWKIKWSNDSYVHVRTSWSDYKREKIEEWGKSLKERGGLISSRS